MPKILLTKARHTTVDNFAILPPLGVMYLAAVLREAGHEVSIYESGYYGRDLRPFRARLESFRPDVLGISALTIEADMAVAMSGLAKRIRRDLSVIIGGPHASSYPEDCARSDGVDFVVIGEGELTVLELVRAITEGDKDPRSVPGVISLQNGEVLKARPREFIQDLNSLPFPAWDLINCEFYARSKPMSTVGPRLYMPVFTSRGCPYKCSYCHNIQGKAFRSRSPQNVLQEMEELRTRFGINDFEIIDDTFNLDAKRMKEILAGIIASESRPALHFPNGLRADLLNEDQIKLLRRAGTLYVAVGIETASERIQKMIGKRLDLDRVRDSIGFLVQEGIFVNGFFMLGFPTETLDEARSTVDWAVRSPLHQAFFFLVSAYAGTELFEQAQHIIKERGIAYSHQNLDHCHTPYNLSDMTDTELFRLYRRAHVRFYASPSRIAGILGAHPCRSHLFSAGFQVFLRMISRPRRRQNKCEFIEE